MVCANDGCRKMLCICALYYCMPISLIHPTGNSPVDGCLRGLIAMFELVFPKR